MKEKLTHHQAITGSRAVEYFQIGLQSPWRMKLQK